ncbi:MAG: 4,5-dioxygenase [Rhodospirillaceae bacterium]|nr:4,5-dioxygenase [Rhodospirillaceae bacterium]|tara:strand:- start:169 stop:492 length:324 start_codon:yes stop_codon:yes gene_type:complete
MEKQYHAHVYFNDDTRQVAHRLKARIKKTFDVEIGSFHEKLVGPHPNWSYQIKFSGRAFGEIVPWLMRNRDGLTIFIHSCTGDNYSDHTKYVCWLGASKQLKLGIFE